MTMHPSIAQMPEDTDAKGHRCQRTQMPKDNRCQRTTDPKDNRSKGEQMPKDKAYKQHIYIG
eukprot:11717222-Karenia_brevis.AAC.1